MQYWILVLYQHSICTINEWVLSSFKWSIFHSAAKNTGGVFIDCFQSFVWRSVGSWLPSAEQMEGALWLKSFIMKKANIGHCHDTHMGLSHCRNQGHTPHARITLMCLERREEAVAVKRSSGGWPCHLGRKVRIRGLKWFTKVKPEVVGRAENRTRATSLPVSALPQDCHTRPFTC